MSAHYVPGRVLSACPLCIISSNLREILGKHRKYFWSRFTPEQTYHGHIGSK